MDKSLRLRRDNAVDRHDAALAAHPNREGDAFKRELGTVVKELAAVVEAADIPSSDPVEVGKTYRWLGDAYFDLAQGAEERSLTSAVQAYQRAESLFARSEAPVEKAKLNFNYGNSLRGLSKGFDVAMLEAAQTRYEAAKRTFHANHLPDLVEIVNEQLQVLEPQLRLARMNADMQRGCTDLDGLQHQLKNTSSVELEEIAHELDELTAIPGRGDPLSNAQEALDALRAQAEKHPERFGDGNNRLDAVTREKDNLKALVQDTTPAAKRTQDFSEDESRIIQALNQRLKSDLEDGRVTPDRAARLGDLLGEFTQVLGERGDDLETLSRKTNKMRDLVARATGPAMSPSWSTPDPRPGSRADQAVKLVKSLKRHVIAGAAQGMLPSEESSAGTNLFTRLIKLESRIREAASEEDRVAAMEDEIRCLAIDIQEHARRYHLTVAQPDFAVHKVHADAKSAVLSGGEHLKKTAEALSVRDNIQLLENRGRGDYAQDRWNQICAANVAVFDVGVPQGEERAQVCYELGLALALGKPIVVVSRPRLEMPFDINLKPIAFTGKADRDADALHKGIYDALSSVVWGGRTSGLGRAPDDALKWLETRFPDRLSDETLQIAMKQADRNRKDAIAFRRSIDQLLGMLGADAPTSLLPAWPPSYPDTSEKPRCFHIMPFGPKWANSVRNLAAKRCQKHNWTYTRGDEFDAQRIIRGIWKEIGSAAAVIVDITGHNENVALELGLAHALGRPYRVMAQNDPEEHSFRSLEKVQVHAYGSTPEFAGFDKIVDTLLGSARS